MSGKIGVAILGSGIFVKEHHLPAVLSCDELVLRGIYSRSLRSAQAVAEDVPASAGAVPLYSEDQDGANTLADLLARDDVQAVIIALPILVQPDFVVQALRAGKHVLSEKPVAKDVAAARALIATYKELVAAGTKATFGVAENIRYMAAYQHAATQVGPLGRVLGVRLQSYGNVKPGGKYFETPWRKVPEYQGGFLLDGGVHQAAALRLLLSAAGVRVKGISAQTAQLQEHLPPVDTADAALRLDNGSTGVLSMSFGTTLTGNELALACEGGTVSLSRDTVTVRAAAGADGKEPAPVVVEKPTEGGWSGVTVEVRVWAKGLVAGKPDPMQSPEEALADLEIIEAILKSGEQGGAPVELAHQI